MCVCGHLTHSWLAGLNLLLLAEEDRYFKSCISVEPLFLGGVAGGTKTKVSLAAAESEDRVLCFRHLLLSPSQ